MSGVLQLELNAGNLRMEIQNFSMEHPNDFGIPDGKERIPMKKLMKLFEIKKKTPPEKQNLFRQLVNEHCELEVMEGLGKVLILKEVEGYESDDTDDEHDYGYGDGNPSIADTVPELARSNSGDGGRGGRFKVPKPSASGGLSVATVESVGVYDPNNNNVRRTGYRRRGSVTRYSIVGQEQVVAEYKKHEDVIQQFRRDSTKLENSIRNLNLGSTSTHSDSGKEKVRDMSAKEFGESFDEGPKRLASPMASPVNNKQIGVRVKGVKKMFGRSRFSLAF